MSEEEHKVMANLKVTRERIDFQRDTLESPPRHDLAQGGDDGDALHDQEDERGHACGFTLYRGEFLAALSAESFLKPPCRRVGTNKQ